MKRAIFAQGYPYLQHSSKARALIQIVSASREQEKGSLHAY